MIKNPPSDTKTVAGVTICRTYCSHMLVWSPEMALIILMSLCFSFLEIQNKKAKEELLAKRVELKSDRKARAMASRTKDNFKGYNGVPIIDQPKKRQSKGDRSEEQDRSNTYDDDDDVDNYDYEGTDSESDEHEQSRPVKPPPQSQSRAEFSNKADSKPKKRVLQLGPPRLQ